MQAMAECSGPPQSTRKDVLGTFYPSPEPVDSSTPSSAPLSRRTLLRHSSFVRAVCVDAPVRICAGGDQRWSSLPRQLPRCFRMDRHSSRGCKRASESLTGKYSKRDCLAGVELYVHHLGELSARADQLAGQRTSRAVIGPRTAM